jgi:hypothetical protein
MHAEAHAWVAVHATTEPVAVLDLGGRDINGTVRDLFPNATEYTVLDIRPGEGVDVVADAAEWDPPRTWDVVVACEVFEHTAVWPAICATAHKACSPGGKFIATMAGPGRPAHSAIDGQFRLHPGEHYQNVPAAELESVLVAVGWRGVVVDSQTFPADTRSIAHK